MADSDKPSPIEDLRKGLGLLFRAAKTTLEQIPTGELEKAVVSSAKEVGRAIENVTNTVEKQIFRKPGSEAPHAQKDAPHDPNAHDPNVKGSDVKPDESAEPPKPTDPKV